MRHPIAAALAGLLLAGSASAADGDATGQQAKRILQGKTVCSNKATGEVCGVDHWTMTVREDGSRTLHIVSDDKVFDQLRIATVNVAADGTFRDTYVNSFLAGAYGGSFYGAVRDGKLHARADDPGGTVNDKVETLPADFRSIGVSPAPGDSLHFQFYDKAKGGKQASTVYVVGGPYYGTMHGRFLSGEREWLGEQEIETPAGTFTANHYQYSPRSQMWVMEPEFVLLRMVMNVDEGEYVFETTELRDLVEPAESAD